MQNADFQIPDHDEETVRRRLRGRAIIMGLIVVVLAVGIIGFNLVKAHFIAQALAQNAAPKQTIAAAKVKYDDWQPQISAVGTLRAVRGVDITTEVTGLVRSVDFHSGEEIAAGAVLVHLNADSDIAQEQALAAAAELAEVVYKRDQVQLAAQAISQAQLDSDAADLKNKRAQQAAQAALVAKKTLRAPFAGKLGITTLNPGQYLNTGDKVVTLQQLDPILVDFRLPQQDLARLAVGQTIALTADTFPGVTFAGHIDAVNPLVDTATRNVQVEASVDNHERRLIPGMFGHLEVAAGKVVHALTLPQSAVTYNPYGATVFLVIPDGANKGGQTVKQTFVTLGDTRGDQVQALSGIKDGDTVVTAGQLKIKNGTPVAIDNSVTPSDDAHPTPQEH
ncbi:MAG TPA: efflux RND transporter periplasmic adaptor subunit [Steroidobacteraceae bacterium]|nr:efflux RND transporter periplasmic adaptor subunit [Steroidobacteraceae bacterium]